MKNFIPFRLEQNALKMKSFKFFKDLTEEILFFTLIDDDQLREPNHRRWNFHVAPLKLLQLFHSFL